MSATVLILRTSKADGSSYNRFIWPESGPVECPDWRPTAKCGHGLHGALWGEGDGSLFNWDADARWQVVEVAAPDVVNLDGKVKFPRGVVVHSGDQLSATAYLAEHGGQGQAIIGGTATAGYGGGTATAGYRGTATAGYGGTATAGYGGTATAGRYGTATAGDGGTATAGYGGTATAGYGGTATAGYRGTATAGYGGTATAGYGGTVVIRWNDAKRYRLTIGYVGDGGIKADTPYRCDDTGRLVEVVPVKAGA